MTDDNTTENSESEGSESADDSAVIKALRAENKDLQKQIRAQPSAADIEARVRASVARESAIEQLLVDAKQPKGLRPLIEETLGDAEVTAEAVVNALKAIGFEVTDSSDDGAAATQQANDLSQVANLGSQVAAAATGTQTDSVGDKIAAAESPAELAQIMREAGLGQ